MKDLMITRLFDAAVELVWEVWTDPKHIMQWWGPAGFTSPSAQLDFREGGTSLVCMRAPKEFGGQDLYNTWVYQKIVPLKLIEFISNLTDKHGRRIDPVSVGVRADFPQDLRTVVTFKAKGSRTELTVAEYGFPDSQMFEFAEMGLNQSFDKMAAVLAAAEAGRIS
jgi:uncharacterized protein YndB with AHSA1/START domain